jgi:hypothetical protein
MVGNPEHKIDLTAAEWFCWGLHKRAEAVAKAAGIRDGQLVLSSFGELPAANGGGSWTRIVAQSKPFALGQHRAMAKQAVAWAKEPGRNVYCGFQRLRTVIQIDCGQHSNLLRTAF